MLIILSAFRDGYHSFSKLSFVDVKIEDAGIYWCIANEVNGERHIEAWNLTVKGNSRFT